MKNHLYNKSFSKYLAIGFILSAFIYPLTAVLILSFSLPTSITNIALKLFYSILYLAIIIQYLRNYSLSFKVISLPLLLFFLLYTVRLVFDISIRHIDFSSGSAAYVYSYFLGATFLPALMIIICYRSLSPLEIYKNLYFVLLIANLLLVWYIFSNGASSYFELLAGRTELNSESNIGTDGVFINPIQISMCGALLAIVAITNILFEKTATIFHTLFSLFNLFLGLYNLFVGASRGPLFGFITILIFISLYRIYTAPKNLKFFTSFLLTFVLSVICYQLIINLRNNFDIFLLDRLDTFWMNLLSNTKEDRNFIYEQSISLFLNSPIIGSQYVTIDGGYPHNIIIEVLMSLGIIGIILFSIMSLNIFVRILYLYRLKVISVEIIGIISVCLLVLFLGLTSGSIFVNPEIWTCYTVLILLPLNSSVV